VSELDSVGNDDSFISSDVGASDNGQQTIGGSGTKIRLMDGFIGSGHFPFGA